MSEKFKILLLGVLIGVVVATAATGNAGDTRLKRRVARLEQRTTYLNQMGYLKPSAVLVPAGCGAGDVVKWDSGIEGLTC